MLAADRLVRSTDLTYGDFNSRTYVTLSLAPGHEWIMQSGSVLSLRAGLRADMSNRDENALMPLFGLTLEQAAGGGTNRFGLEFFTHFAIAGLHGAEFASPGLVRWQS